MNEVIKTILSRRSVRSFTNEMVPKEMIEEIVNAGQYAPSAMNSQSPIILVVTRKDLIERMSKMNAQALGTENFDPFFGAPALLVVLAERNAPCPEYDGSLVMENMMIAATSLGLGTCWINRAKEVFDSLEETKEVVDHIIASYDSVDGPFIYAVILDVNVKIEDEVIGKYIKNI